MHILKKLNPSIHIYDGKEPEVDPNGEAFDYSLGKITDNAPYITFFFGNTFFQFLVLYFNRILFVLFPSSNSILSILLTLPYGIAPGDTQTERVTDMTEEKIEELMSEIVVTGKRRTLRPMCSILDITHAYNPPRPPYRLILGPGWQYQ